MIATRDITGLILAGGRGSRMGGVDKGLQPFHGLPLARHALARLRPQVGSALLNANRNLADYAAFGAPVWPDAQAGDYAGPLAGFLAGLDHCSTGWLLAVPCDSPLFPHDLAARLAAAARAQDACMAMAATPEAADDGTTALRRQPVFCLMHASLRDSLAQFLASGGRKVGQWAAQHACAVAAFDQPGDDPLAFANANTLQELRVLESTPSSQTTLPPLP